MKHALLFVSAVAILITPAQAAQAAPPAFKDKPSAVREAGRLVIRFSVAAPTDVEIRILDGQGKVVRHLAAGRLGKNAPPPLKADSLDQAVAWDGTDDASRPVLGPGAPGNGPFKAVVSLGLAPTLDRVIGNNPADLGGIRALAVGPDGKLYVFHCFASQHPNNNSAACAVFDRTGQYLRTILPFAADLPDSRLTGIRRIDTSWHGHPGREDTPRGESEDHGQDAHATKAPYLYQPETRSYLPGLGDLPCQRAVVTADGKLAFVGIQAGPRPFAQPGMAQLTVVNTDGGVPAPGPLRAVLHPLTDTFTGLALSPDEKTLYAVGIRAGMHPNGPSNKFTCDVCDHGGETWLHTIPVPMVFTCDFEDVQAQVVIGGEKPSYGRASSQPGERAVTRKELESKRLIEPVSVATDKAGNIYVADVAADSILVVTPPDPARGHTEFIKRIDIKKPIRVEVNRKTGAIYVLTAERDTELVKLASLADPRPVARLTVVKFDPESNRGRDMAPTRRPIIALDDNADPPIVWVGQPFWRVEDLGDHFGKPLDLRDPARVGERAFAAVMEMSIDRVHGWLYVNNARRMNTTAEGKPTCDPEKNPSRTISPWAWETFKLTGNGMWPNSSPGSANGSAGRDGNYYVDTGAGGANVYRYDPALKLTPFEHGGDKKGLGLIHGMSLNRGVGLTADYNGNVLALWKKSGASSQPGDMHRASSLYKYDPQGRPCKVVAARPDGPWAATQPVPAPVIDCQFPSIYSPRVDRAGNIYVALGLRPGSDLLAPGLAGQVPAAIKDPDAVNGVNGYPLVYGSVAKFPPTGGSIRQGIGGVPCNFGPGTPIEVKGAQWIVPGISVSGSYAAPKRSPGTIISCVCEFPNIDVDEFGRTFFPDAARCRVTVVDTAGNEICTFGSYGNVDCVGGKSPAGPAIPMWWPQAVAVDDTHAFVGDRLNRRLLAVRLTYATSAECAVP